MNSNESFDRTASHMAGEYVSHNEPVAWMDKERETPSYMNFARAILRKASEK